MSERVTISLDETVLVKLDDFRKKTGLTRSSVIATAVNDYISACEVRPIFKDGILRFTGGLQALVKGEISQEEFSQLCDSISLDGK